jgi:hypothetical protein
MNELFGAYTPFLPEYYKQSSLITTSFDVSPRIERFKTSFRNEFKNISKKDKIIAGSALAAAVWEWGPLNEFIATVPSIAVLNNTGSPVIAGIVGGTIYATQQGILGMATSAALDKVPDSVQSAQEELNINKEKGSLLHEKGLLLMGAGISAVVVNERLKNNESSFKKDAKLIGKLTLALAAIDIAVFGSANAAIQNAEAVNIDPTTVTDIATNPLTYLAIFGIAKFAATYNKYRKNVKNKN